MSLTIEAKAEPIPGYQLIERLGGGGFGEVWKAAAPGGLLKAIKIVHGDVRTMDEDGAHRAGQELAALQRVQSLRHPYLLSIERYDIVDDRLIIVTELADCNLFDRYEHFKKLGQSGIPRNILLRYLRETAEVLDLMNQQYQLQHLDIKPQNLFLIHDHVKVADFGLVKDLKGIRTEMTGGVTPVYAAPETFGENGSDKGVISPFCDQYSLAIVYQELLTGIRPFSGINMHQLVMQHLQAPPNLAPLPHADRPAIAKALAKKPENRHASCMAMVDALQQPPTPTRTAVRPTAPIVVDRASVAPRPTLTPGATATRINTPPVNRRALPDVAQSIRRLEQKGSKPFHPQTPPTMIRVRREDMPRVVEEPQSRSAPPEFTGNGVLTPAIIIGLGHGGLIAVRQFRLLACARFGGMTSMPHIKLLAVDSDPEASDAATRGAAGAALEPDEIFLMRLNRASHYLKPRRNGRSLIEGWFDSQWLYRIPRNPEVVGQRALGRLAFGDYYSPFCAKLESLLEEVTGPDALLRADRNTMLGVRTNRPRVYVIAGLGGGTGSGMFLDTAYVARRQLAHLGYVNPHVTGLLFLPPVDKSTPESAQATANSFAALTELMHFQHPDSQYQCSFDDRDGTMSDKDAPFSRCTLLPWELNADIGSTRDGPAQAADFLFRELTSHLGNTVDHDRTTAVEQSKPTGESSATTFGLSVFSWPRRSLLFAAARRLCRIVTERWASRDTAAIRSGIHAWVDEQLASHNISSDELERRLNQACREVIGGKDPERLFNEYSRPFTSTSWFGKSLDPEAGFDFVNRCDELLGKPETGRMSSGSLIGDALLSAAEAIAKDWGAQLAKHAVTLIEQPEYRLPGAEEAVKYLRGRLEEIVARRNDTAQTGADAARKAHLRMQGLLNGPVGRRSGAEFGELAADYPQVRFRAMVDEQIAEVCQTLCSDLMEQLEEIHFCRQRLESLVDVFCADAEAPPASRHYLLPNGCQSPDEAIEQLLANVNDKDFIELDRKMQRMVQGQFTALVHVCMSTSNLLGNLEPAMVKIAQQFLESRVGEIGVAELFFTQCSSEIAVKERVREAFDDAAPPLGDTIGVMVREVCALSVPAGESGQRFADAARQTLNEERFPIVTGHDDIAFYRELPRMPLARLPQLGPLAKEIYRQITDRDRYPPHSRNDIEAWLCATG